jgi:hypothetical protein
MVDLALNLLRPLWVLLEERHVSNAADRLGISEPAMSRTLQRLRSMLGDELLVRGKGRATNAAPEPTASSSPYAKYLHGLTARARPRAADCARVVHGPVYDVEAARRRDARSRARWSRPER